MSRAFDIVVDAEPPLRRTRMPRRNAIVRRKRGRTDKSDDRSAEGCYDDPSILLLNDDACTISSGSMTAATVVLPEEAGTEEERRRLKSTVHNHKDLMPLRDLAMLMSTQLTCALMKGGIGSSNVSTKGLAVISEKDKHTPTASKA